jgi:hypothetical protein
LLSWIYIRNIFLFHCCLQVTSGMLFSIVVLTLLPEYIHVLQLSVTSGLQKSRCSEHTVSTAMCNGCTPIRVWL